LKRPKSRLLILKVTLSKNLICHQRDSSNNKSNGHNKPFTGANPTAEGARGPGGVDLGSLLNNPNLMSMASQMMSNPQIQQMMQDPQLSRMFSSPCESTEEEGKKERDNFFCFPGPSSS